MPSQGTTPRKPTDRQPKAAPKAAPRTKAQSNKPKGSSWTVEEAIFPLELPSGETCDATRPGVQDLIAQGVLHSMDSLTSVVQGFTLPNAEGKTIVDVKQITDKPENMEMMLDMMDRIVIAVVVDPKVETNMRDIVDEEGKVTGKEKIPIRERTRGTVYVDFIDTEDKMFIMQFAMGGTSDLDQFRAESAFTLGGLPNGQADGAAS